MVSNEYSRLIDSDQYKEKQAAAEGKQNELFIGGIDQKGGGSGLAVIGPPGGVPGGGPPMPSRPDTFDRIFERAQDRSEDDSESAPREEAGSRRVITMYRNGFVVDDGPFRDATSPENQLFIRSLEAGRVPVGASMVMKTSAKLKAPLIPADTHDSSIVCITSLQRCRVGLLMTLKSL